MWEARKKVKVDGVEFDWVYGTASVSIMAMAVTVTPYPFFWFGSKGKIQHSPRHTTIDYTATLFHTCALTTLNLDVSRHVPYQCYEMNPLPILAAAIYIRAFPSYRPTMNLWISFLWILSLLSLLLIYDHINLIT